MSTYAIVNMFGYERYMDSDGYPELVVPEILNILKQAKSKMKKHKLNITEALFLVMKNNDIFCEGCCDRSDYTYLITDFKTVYINGIGVSLKKLHKYTEEDYEKLYKRIENNHKDDEEE